MALFPGATTLSHVNYLCAKGACGVPLNKDETLSLATARPCSEEEIAEWLGDCEGELVFGGVDSNVVSEEGEATPSATTSEEVFFIIL